MLEEVAVRSASGKFCAPVEAKPCLWSSRTCHPDDLRVCEMTGLPIHFEFATANTNPRLQPLVDLLNGIKRTADEPQMWDAVTTKVAATLGKGRCRVEAAVLSPNRRHLAVCSEVRTLFGFRVHQAGLIYAIGDHSVVGRTAQGRRTSEGWSAAQVGSSTRRLVPCMGAIRHKSRQSWDPVLIPRRSSSFARVSAAAGSTRPRRERRDRRSSPSV